MYFILRCLLKLILVFKFRLIFEIAKIFLNKQFVTKAVSSPPQYIYYSLLPKDKGTLLLEDVSLVSVSMELRINSSLLILRT